MKKVVLVGASVYGLENHSDDSMLKVFTREIHANMDDVRIVLLARHPSKELDEVFNVKSIKNLDHNSKEESKGRWFNGLNRGDSTEHLNRIWKEIESCDLLVIGGEPFLEISLGLWKGLAPYISLIITIGKFLGKKIMINGIHMGRALKTKMGIELTKFCVENADLITVREDFSKQILAHMGMPTNKVISLADAAWGSNPGTLELAKKVLKGENIKLKGRKVIGVTFRHMYWKWSKVEWERISHMLARVYDRLIEELDVDLLFIPNCTYSTDDKFADDRATARETVEKMIHKDHTFQVTGKRTVFETLALYNCIDMIFSNRRHCLIFGAIHEKAGVGVGEEWHMIPVMKPLNIANNFISLEDITEEKLLKTIIKTWEQREEIVKSFKDEIPKQREKALMNGEFVANIINDNKGVWK